MKSVHDEAVDLPPHHDRRVPDRAQERRRALDDAGVRPGRWHDLGGGNEIGRIDGVNDQTARASLAMSR